MSRFRWRKQWGYWGLVGLMALLFTLCVRSLVQGHTRVAGSQANIELGWYPNPDDAQRAATQALADVLKANPQVQYVVVRPRLVWLSLSTLKYEPNEWRWEYDRQDHALQYYSNDQTGGPYIGVTEQAIYQAAKAHGSPEDVGKYGARWGGI